MTTSPRPARPAPQAAPTCPRLPCRTAASPRSPPQVLPGVVSIQFSGPQGGGSGSGVVIDESGLILTNNHVVEGAADGGSLTVSFQDGTSTLGRDRRAVTPASDLAVIRVDDVDNLVAVAARVVRRPAGRRDRDRRSARRSGSTAPSRPES